MLGQKQPFPARMGREPFPASGLGFPSLAAAPGTLCTSSLGICPVVEPLVLLISAKSCLKAFAHWIANSCRSTSFI